MADMSIFEHHSFPHYWKSAVAATKPRWLVVDANWSDSGIRSWIEAGKEHLANVALEPVSVEKSTRLFSSKAGLGQLGLYPDPSVHLATPNMQELSAMYFAASENGYFERTGWFDVIDSFGMRGARDRFVQLTSAELTDSGVPVQSVQLLPYIPAIVTKLGAQGALLTMILGRDDPRLRDGDSQQYILARTVNDHPTVGGIYMRMYQPAETVKDIVSVNGVGDTFLGVLVSGLAQGGRVDRLVDVAQKGAVLSLKCHESVSRHLAILGEELSRVAEESK